MANKKILITGSSGYIGRNLAKKLGLIATNEILLLDIANYIPDSNRNRNITFEKVNLEDIAKLSEIVKDFNPDTIYHLGANINRDRNYTDFENLFRTNVIGTLNLLKALSEINYSSFIFVSTGEVYAGSPHPPCKESDLIMPLSPYSVTKASAEMVVQNFSQIQNKPYRIFRIFNIYGKDMPAHFFLGHLKTCLRSKTKFNMTEGKQKRDFIYIDDVLDCLSVAGENMTGQNEILNICSGKGISLSEIIKILKHDFQLDLSVNVGAIPYRENEVFDLTGDENKCFEILGFKSRIDIHQGLKKCFIEFM